MPTPPLPAATTTVQPTKFLRVKRKRGDAPFSTILVDDLCGRLKKRPSLISAFKAMTADKTLNTSGIADFNASVAKTPARQYVFKRFRTMDMAEAPGAKRARRSYQQQTIAPGQSSGTTPDSARGVEAGGGGDDLADGQVRAAVAALARAPGAPRRGGAPTADCRYTSKSSHVADGGGGIMASNSLSSVTCDGKPLVRTPVAILAPDERPIDEAVWVAFQTGSFDHVFKLVAHGTSVDYQRRAADNTTALMAAAYHGNRQVVEELLNLGADLSLRNRAGLAAADIAAEANHAELAAWMRQLANGTSGVTHEQRRGGRAAGVAPPSEFVYDIYRCCDASGAERGTSQLPPEIQAAAAASAAELKSQLQPPKPPLVLRIGARSIVQNWTVGGRAVEAVDDLEWELDGAEEDGHDAGDTEDSNDEDYWGNDYPDEESAGSSDDGGDKNSSGSSSGEDYEKWHNYGRDVGIGAGAEAYEDGEGRQTIAGLRALQQY